MLLYEVLNGPLMVKSTSRFTKSYAKFAKGYPVVPGALQNFLAAKVNNAFQPVSGKDEPYTGGILKGVFHVHFVHGKVICVYGITPHSLVLYDMIDHNGQEGSSVNKLARFILDVTPDELQPFEFQRSEPEAPINIEAIEAHLYDMAARPADRRVLVQALRTGDLSDLSDYAELLDMTIAQFVAAYGSEEKLRSRIAQILKSIGAT